MPDLTANRTLVKSPPELWEELSEVERLAKHLGAFGEITITKLEPEHTVAWEGEHASGTVSIEPSGWGTKVTLRAELPEAAAPPEPEPPLAEPEPEPPLAEPEPDPPPQAEAQRAALEAEPGPADAGAEPLAEPAQPRGFWAWLFKPRRLEPITEQAEPVAGEAEADPHIEAPEPPLAEPEPPVAEPEPPLAEPEPPVEEPEPAAEAPETASPLDPDRARVILDEALDTLGAAHHRPFSRG